MGFDYELFLTFDDNVDKVNDTVRHPFGNGLYDSIIRHRIDPSKNFVTHWETRKGRPVIYVSRIDYDFEKDQLNEVINILKLFCSAPQFLYAESEFFSSSNDRMYHDFQHDLYNEYKGKIPYSALLKSSFQNATESMIEFYKEKLREGLKEFQVDISDFADNHLVISKNTTA